MNFKEYLLTKFGYNEPIYLNEINYKSYSRPWIFKELKKLIDNGELRRFDSGIYFFPKKMPWGDSVLNTNKIVEHRFLSNGDDTYGYITGAALLNRTGLSTQVPNIIELVSNNESTRIRDIYIGTQLIRVRRSRSKITKDNVKTLQFLDSMNLIKPSDMDETEHFMLKKYVKTCEVTRSDLSLYSNFFPARVMKNMIESGVVYDLA